jgi:hypothetical protein
MQVQSCNGFVVWTFSWSAHSLVYLEKSKVELTIYLIKHKKSLNFNSNTLFDPQWTICHQHLLQSLTANIIIELRERLESTDNYTKQLGLITEMEEKGILLSHFLKFTLSGVETSEGVWDSDETLMENLFEDRGPQSWQTDWRNGTEKVIYNWDSETYQCLSPQIQILKAGAAVSIVAWDKENVLLCTMCGKTLLQLYRRKQCVEIVFWREKTCMCWRQQLQISHRMLLRTRIGLREKERGVPVPLFPILPL